MSNMELTGSLLTATRLAITAALAVPCSAMTVTTSFPSLRAAGHGLGYGIYAAFAVLSFVFVRWVVTDTNGRQLEAMQEQITVPPATRVLRDRPKFEG
jgi:MFS transporter, SP family, sugar:H+ symporter